jgi:hypothetical protein
MEPTRVKCIKVELSRRARSEKFFDATFKSHHNEEYIILEQLVEQPKVGKFYKLVLEEE